MHKNSPLILIAGFGSILVLMSTLFYLAVAHLGTMKEMHGQLAHHAEKMEIAFALREAVHRRNFSLSLARAMPDFFDRDAEQQRFNGYARDFVVARERLIQLGIDPEERAVLGEFEKKARASRNLVERAMATIVHEPDEAGIDSIINQATAIQSGMFGDLDRFIFFQKQAREKRFEKEENKRRRMWRNSAFLGASIIIISMMISFFVIHRERRHLKILLKEIAEREKAEQMVRDLNASLEKKVGFRTKSLSKEIELRKGTEEKLRESETRHRVTIATAPVAIITTDEHGKIDSFNPAAERVFGYREDEAIGQSIKCLMPRSFAANHDQNMADYMKTGESKIINIGRDVLGQRKDGTVFPIHLSVSNMTMAGQQKFVGVIEDVTDRKQAEHNLIEAKETAEVANHAKSEFLATMSHELRTPLNAIIGFSEISRAEIFGPLGNEKYMEYAIAVNDSGRHLLSIINDILDLSVIEADKLELDEEPVGLATIATVAVQLIGQQAENGGVNLSNTVGIDLPLIRADKRRIKQILFNILSNAVKFTPEGGEVTISANRDSTGGITVLVTDTGIGMDDAGIAKALEPFGQVESSQNRLHGGTGLGLPLTISLIEVHGGTFEITSSPDKGTTVTVRFPAERVIVQKEAAPA